MSWWNRIFLAYHFFYFALVALLEGVEETSFFFSAWAFLAAVVSLWAFRRALSGHLPFSEEKDK